MNIPLRLCSTCTPCVSISAPSKGSTWPSLETSPIRGLHGPTRTGSKRWGARVTVVAPKTLLPPGVQTWGVDVSCDFDQVVKDADVVMMLRVQKERIEEKCFPNEREYSFFYGLNKRRVDMMKPGAIIMHPGPMNRGVEITHDAADGNRSIILNQVENGVAVRMTLLYLSLGGNVNGD